MPKPRSTLFDRPRAFRVLIGHAIMPLKNGPVEYINLAQEGLWCGRLVLPNKQVVLALYTRSIRVRRAFAWYEVYGYDIGQEITMLEYGKYSAMIEQRVPHEEPTRYTDRA